MAQGPPRSYTYPEAFEALKQEAQIYQIYVDEQRMKLLDFYNRLLKGPYNFQDVNIRHPDSWSVSFHRYAPGSTIWYMDRSSPVGRYGVLVRSYGTIQMNISDNDLFTLWDIIIDYFPDIQRDLQVRQALLQQNTELKSQMAEGFIRNRGGPEDLGVQVASYIEGPRRKGWAVGKNNIYKINTSLLNNGANVPRHLKKINTTLFTNKGGKRKQRGTKTRRQRKH
jgi:hypothetical protein